MLPKTVNISIEDNDVRGKVIELQWKKYFMSLSQCSTSWSYQESETWLLQDEMILYNILWPRDLLQRYVWFNSQ